jgi:hypothetical protein
MLRQLIDRMLGRDGRAEADVRGDPARVNARAATGEVSGRSGSTTSTHGAEGYVGRVAGDEDFSGETGAERRAGS